MSIIQNGPLFAMICGLFVLAVGVAYFSRVGKALVLLGAALVIGPLAPMLDGRVSDSARVVLSAASIGLSVAAIGLTLSGLIDRRARQRSS